jgi:hypothetical protein
MEATCSSETSVDFQRTTQRNVPEDRILNYARLLFWNRLHKAYKIWAVTHASYGQTSQKPIIATDIKKSKIRSKATSVSKYYATNAVDMWTQLPAFNLNTRHIIILKRMQQLGISHKQTVIYRRVWMVNITAS